MSGKKSGKKESSGPHLQLKVIGHDGHTMFFRVKSTTSFEKIRNKYAETRGWTPGKIEILVDGASVDHSKSPADYHLDEDAEVNVFWRKDGGCGLF